MMSLLPPGPRPLEPASTQTVSVAAPCTPTTALHALLVAIDGLKLILWTRDAGGALVFVNPQASPHIPRPLPAEHWALLIHPDDVQRVSQHYRAALAAREEYCYEYRLRRADGGWRWMIDAGAPITDSGGNFAGYTGAITDITAQHEATERLARVEAEHILLMEHSSDLIAHCDTNGNYIYVSPEYENLLGWKRSEMLGKSLYAFLHPDDQKTAAAMRDHLFQPGNENAVVEVRKLDRQGRYYWLGTKARPIIDPVSGAYVGAVMVSRNIDAERRAREALRISEARFRSLTELSADWYWETDAEGRFTVVSTSVQAVTGRHPDHHLIGRTMQDLASEDEGGAFAPLLALMEKRLPFRQLLLSTRLGIDGAQRYSRISGTPVYEQGAFVGYRGVGTDTTELVHEQQQRARLAAENEALIDHSLDLIMLVDADGIILRVNPIATEVLGYATHEITGRNYIDFVAEECVAETETMLQQMLPEHSEMRDFENQWRCKDGTRVYLSWSARWTEDKTRMIATARNVTERRQASVALQRSREELNDVLESIGDAVFAVDRQWYVTYSNSKAAQSVGLTREQVRGKLLWDIAPDLKAPGFQDHYQRAMRTGAPQFFESYYPTGGIWTAVRIYPREDGLSVFFHDVTEHHAAAEKISRSERRMRQLIAATPAGYMRIGANGRIDEVNAALCALCGYSESEAVGMCASALFEEGSPMLRNLQAQDKASLPKLETVLRHRDGHTLVVLIHLAVERDAQGQPEALSAFVTDITDRKEVEKRLTTMATSDALTGLPNRHFLDEHLPLLLKHSPRGQHTAIMFIDLDRFKSINDTLGHAAGDLVLREVASRLQVQIRQGDMITRIGGDEFLIVTPCGSGPESTAAACAIAEKLVAALSIPIDIDGQQASVGISIGIAMSPDDGRTVDVLLERADAAMYRVKLAGRNGYALHGPMSSA